MESDSDKQREGPGAEEEVGLRAGGRGGRRRTLDLRNEK